MGKPVKLGQLIEALKSSGEEKDFAHECTIGEYDTPALLDVPDGSMSIPSKSLVLSRSAIIDLFAVLKDKYGTDFLKEVYFNRHVEDDDMHSMVVNSTMPRNQFMDVVRKMRDLRKGYEGIENDMFGNEPGDDEPTSTREYLDTIPEEQQITIGSFTLTPSGSIQFTPDEQ